MTPVELAKIYMLSFFGEKPLEDMKSILAEDLQFTGSFYTYNTAEDYLESLKEAMPTEAVSYKILKEIENGNTCCLVYQSRQQGMDETMAQLFEINDNRITRIRVILDASRLLNKPDA